MTTLVTGAAGFIGFHVARALLARGEEVVGVDDLNDYYPVALKEARVARLKGERAFTFHRLDLADDRAVLEVLGGRPFRRICHLAAQAGVRHSLDAPLLYVRSNVAAHVVVLELARRLSGLEHLVYASSSSVYGANEALPYSVADRVDRPVSLYAATKRADELVSHAYSHLHGFPQTGLRFFTVYGPWGRPDMAYWTFTEAILRGEPIPLFNRGQMRRDFTYVDDIVAGVLAALDRPATSPAAGHPPHRLYNLGAGRAEALGDMVAILERCLGREAKRQLLPMQPGDVPATHAEIKESREDLGYDPATPLAEGLPRFVEWYREHHGV